MSKGPENRPLVDPLAGNPISALQRASLATIGALSAAFDRLGLRVIDAATLRLIAANPGCNQGEIGRALGVQRTNMVPIVAGLVDAGHVERRVADGRTHALYLTREGKALVRRLVTAGEKVQAQFFGDLGEDGRADLLAMLNAVQAKANRP